jgi:hypothetical protein
MSAMSIKQRARELIAAENAAAAAKLQKEQQEALTVRLQREQRECEARLRAAAERERAMIRAERLEAEAAARAEAEAEKVALDEEMERLRNRSPLEIIQEELEEMKQMVRSLTTARVQREGQAIGRTRLRHRRRAQPGRLPIISAPSARMPFAHSLASRPAMQPSLLQAIRKNS